MRKSNITIAIGLLGLSGYILIDSISLGVGSLRIPRAGFFPALLSVILAVLSLVLLGQAARETGGAADPFRLGSTSWTRVACAVSALLAFGLLVDYLGYALSSFLFITILLRATESIRWSLIVVIALSTSVISYGIFGWLLQTPLPPGIFGI
jgi:putative tricarboxylic transport membrane protein